MAQSLLQADRPHDMAILLQQISPEVLASIFLPVLLFAGASALNREALIKSAVHVVLLGIFGVLTGTVMSAVGNTVPLIQSVDSLCR